MTVVSTLPPGCEASEREIILAIFSSIGRCRFLPEKHFDACTALCGSGPAFVSIVLESLADGGVMMGLPRAEALELAAQSKDQPRVNRRLLMPSSSCARDRSHGITDRHPSSSTQRFSFK